MTDQNQIIELVRESYLRGRKDTIDTFVETLTTFSRMATTHDIPDADMYVKIYDELVDVFSTMVFSDDLP